MTKPFLTYQQQLDKLSKHKNLIINDYVSASQALHNIGYFSLINGYKTPFINPMSRLYENNATFDDILALYEFDKALRELIFKYICEIETSIRQLSSYAFCNVHGENQTAYLTPQSYQVTKKNLHQVQKLIKTLDYQANQNTAHNYLIHQRTTYKNVPLWVVMNTLTFGQLSHFYSYLPYNIQSNISKEFPNVNEHDLERYLDAITLFRNACAHNERLYCFRLASRDFPDSVIHKKLNIPQKGTQYLQGKKDLFGLVIAFRHLLPQKHFLNFKKELNQLINTYHKTSSAISHNDLLAIMGFPRNWNNITRYKI
jgi:abortive infection bacteriophage resistance protein